MRLKDILLIGSLLLAVKGEAQDKKFVVVTDTDGSRLLKGEVTKKELINDSSYRWFYSGVNRYLPDMELLQYVRALKDSFTMVVFGNTWAASSRKFLPALYSVTIRAGIQDDAMKLYMVDREMKTLGNELAFYRIVRVPTVLVLKNGVEVGRIEGAPKKSMEADLADIFSRNVKVE